MTIIADSGSTKTIWMDVKSGNKIVTEGLNPHFTTDETFLAACSTVCQHFHLSPLTSHLFFYGAGCGNTKQQKRVASLLTKAFESNSVSVETDMLGACRAVSDDQESLVAILGTGSNACYFNGEKIKYQPKSTGYILGDRGSANHVGRLLLDEYLTHTLPTKARHRFHERIRMSDTQLIDAVYHKPNPNRFLASLAPFAVEQATTATEEEGDYCYGIIWGALLDFYCDTLIPILHKVRRNECPLNIVGGFAKAIEPILDRFFGEEGIKIKLNTVVDSPINGLRQYHIKQNTL